LSTESDYLKNNCFDNDLKQNRKKTIKLTKKIISFVEFNKI